MYSLLGLANTSNIVGDNASLFILRDHLKTSGLAALWQAHPASSQTAAAS